MEAKKAAGTTLDSLISSFNGRISQLQELVIARNMYPGSSMPDLLAVDASLTAMELQLQAIKDRLREETESIPKAKKLIEAASKQQKKLRSMSAYVPSHFSKQMAAVNTSYLDDCLQVSNLKLDPVHMNPKVEDEPPLMPKEKKKRGSPSLWYITSDELDSLSSYMRGRLTIERINAAIDDMATYAEANAQLISAPKKKVVENNWEKALELRDIAMTEPIKGKHFFLETDMKGPTLKLDNTGKAILTVLRHLGRITEIRAGHHRVIILLKPH